jgi:Protein of unknown function (DUF3089)
MQQGSRQSLIGGRIARMLIVASLAAFAVLGVAASGASAMKGSTVWLCKQGQTPDPCTGAKGALNTTDINGNLEETLVKVKAKAPKVDCFYVYPTVSEQLTPNANLTIEPQEEAVAEEQASRFSQDCKVYAPMYEQLTLAAINGFLGPLTQAESIQSYLSVKTAFLEYLTKFNKGRPFVLIGHSQGSAELEQLIKEQVDTVPSVRSKLVSAIILGGNVFVPEGKTVGGSFQNVPTCQSATQTHCVIAFSTFYQEPPIPSNFGRATSGVLGAPPPPGSEIVCVNPALLTQNGGSGPLLPSFTTKPFPGAIGKFTGPTPVSKLGTPWVSLPGQYTAQCKNEGGAQWLNVTPVGNGDQREDVQELLGPEWGLHLFDVGLTVGNLVNTVAIQERAFAFES